MPGVSCACDGKDIQGKVSGKSISFEIPESGGDINLTFNSNSYLFSMSLTYIVPFPGDPTDVAVKDTTWDLSNLSETGQSFQDIGIQRGEVDGLKIDASGSEAKFDPREGDTQVNANTVIYVPIAQSAYGATLTISGQGGSVTVKVDDKDVSFNTPIDLSTTENAHYVAISFGGSGSSYITALSVDYAEDTSTYPGTPDVSATDTTWDLTGTDADAIQNARGDYENLRIDALSGKFDPRESNTQVNPGTVIYVPIAADAQGAILRIEGNNNGNLDITLDDSLLGGNIEHESVSLGRDIAIDATNTHYVALTFSGGNGNSPSCYLSSISVDYGSDKTESYHVVTVGTNGDYQTINEALADNDSSLKDHLVLSIAPGSYNERVIIDKEGVIFQNADETNEHPVIIHAAYYSSNTWDTDGTYLPQDKFDLGTNECATVLVRASGKGFSARGITFQNDYNLEGYGHTGEDDQTPAVAFCSNADKIDFVDCRFIGRQDTLYLMGVGNRASLTNCYIEGTVDFIFGDADAYFNGCSIHMASFPGRDSGYFTAANTKSGYTGLVFYNCTLTADPSLTDVSLGRPWQNLCAYTSHVDATGRTIYSEINPNTPNPDYANISSAVTFIGCTMPDNIMPERWSRWTGHNEDGDTVSITYDPTVRFTEIGCFNADGTPVVNNDSIVLGKVIDEDAAQKLEDYLSSMLIGQNGWNPAELAFQNDGDFWLPATSLEPGQPSQPEDEETEQPNTDNNDKNNNSNTTQTSDTTNRDENTSHAEESALPATGDTYTAVVVAGVAVLAGALLGASAYMRTRAGKHQN